METKWHLTVNAVISDRGKNHRSLEWPTNQHLNYVEKIIVLQMEKSDRHHFTQMVKLKTTNLGRSQCLPCPQKGHITYEELLQKTWQNHQASPRWRTPFRPTDLASSWETVPDWRRPESHKDQFKGDPWSDPDHKNHKGDIGEIWVCGLNIK